MRSRSFIVLALGVVIALVVALTLRSRMSGDEGNHVQVLVAASDIPAGAFVRIGDNIAFVDWPEDKITDSMLTSTATKTEEFNGAVARQPVQKGEPLSKSELVKANEGGFMSAVLEPGTRAISIAVDSTSGNAGFIFPGDHVDLILTQAVNQKGTQARASETIMENLRVLAIDQMMGNPDNKAVLAKTVTVEVTPKQAEEINVAKDLGKLSLSLRSLATAPQNAAATPVNPPATTFDDVLRETENLPPGEDDNHITRDTDVSKFVTPQGVSGSVRVIRGSGEQVIQFNGGDTGGGHSSVR